MSAAQVPVRLAMAMEAAFLVELSGNESLPVHGLNGDDEFGSTSCAIRFASDGASAWIGKLQSGCGYATSITTWDHANALVVIVGGAIYFIDPQSPCDSRFLDSFGISCHFSPSGDVAFLCTYTDVFAIDTDGSELWRRTVAIDGFLGIDIEGDVLRGSAGMDPPDVWVSFALNVNDGSDAH